MLDELLIGIDDCESVDGGQLSVGLIPVIDLSGKEEIVVFNFSLEWVGGNAEISISKSMTIMHSHMLIN